MLPELALILALLASSAQKTNPCGLLDRATVVALLGSSSAGGIASGPEPDEDSGGTVSYCTFKGGTGAMVVSQVTFASPEAARNAATKELVAGRMEGEEAKISEEPGLGEKAWWTYTTEGAQFVVLKGTVVLGVAIGGGLPNPPVSYRSALRAATASALLKL